METTGCWFNVRVDATLLRSALGLPSHSMLDSRTCNECAHNETVGPDVMDTYHSAIQSPHQPSAPRSTPAPTFPEDYNDDDGGDSYRFELEGV